MLRNKMYTRTSTIEIEIEEGLIIEIEENILK